MVRYKSLERIVGSPYYRVGDDGSVWSNAWGRWRKRKLSRLRDQGMCVPLRVGNRYIFSYVHRLVLEAFVGPCPFGMEGCHNDGDPTNNNLVNLRWDTHKNNEKDKIKHGTSGKSYKLGKFSVLDIQDEMSRPGITKSRMAEKLATAYGVHPIHIYAVARGKFCKQAANRK